MSGALFITRWHLRRHWRTFALLAIAVALATGFVLTTATGARRTATAWQRMREQTRAPDIESWTDKPDELEAALKSEPGVVATGQYTWMYVYPLLGAGVPAEGMYVAVSDSMGRDITVPRIVAGRAADPTRVDEFTINEAMAELTGLAPGDSVELRSGPDAVQQTATVVGIYRGSKDVDSDAGLISGQLTRAFGDRWLQPYLDSFGNANPGSSYPVAVNARFAPGTDLDQVIEDLRAKSIDPAPERVDQESTALGDTLDAQRTAYTLLALVGGVGALIALGQVASRRIRRSNDELAVVGVLGLSRPQRMLAAAGAPLAAVAIGVLTAPALAFGASGTVPSGLAGRVDPSSGLHFDAVVDVVSCVAIMTALGLVCIGASARLTRKESSRMVGGVWLDATARPARRFGFRVARGWATVAERLTARSQLAGVVVAVAVATAVATWSSSAHDVSHHASLWGITWDATIGVNEEALGATDFQSSGDVWPIMSDLGDQLVADDSLISSLAAVQVGDISIEGHQLEAAVFDNRLGRIWPPIIAGRDPRGPDEINAARGVTDRAGWSIGDSLVAGSTTVRLVGEVVVPALGTGDFGSSIVMSQATLDRLGGSFELNLLNSSYLFVDLAPGVTKAELAAAIDDPFIVVDPPPPSPVFSLEAIGGVDELLLIFVAAIGAAGFLHGVRTAAAQRRRDHAVLRALGARSQLILSATSWQTAFTVGIGLVVGLPLGLVAGRIAWTRTATGMGVVAAHPSPVAVIIGIAAASVACGAIVACSVGAIAVRSSGTRALRQE